MIRWEQPGYVVAFTTRIGGVSRPPFDSLNLSAGTGDEPAAVEHNRRIACESVGLDARRLAFNKQVHSAVVHRAVPGRQPEPGDGLWSDEPGLPLVAFSADCLPIAIVSLEEPRRIALLHAGWRGVSGGIVAAGIGALGSGEKAAVIGPAIGRCCYEIGPEVARLFDDDLVRDGRLDLRAAGERALRAAGVMHVDHVERCTRDDATEFFSHRRDGRARGVQGVVGAVA